MKTLSKAEYDSFDKATREIVDQLGIPVEDRPPSIPKPSRRTTDSVLEKYACVVQTDCRLCLTVVTQVFIMEGVGGLLTSSESNLHDIEGMTVKTRYESTFTCPTCHDTLKLIEQEDLIALTIRVAKGETRCQKRS